MNTTNSLRSIDRQKFAPETEAVANLAGMSDLAAETQQAIRQQAVELVQLARGQRRRKGMMESFLQEFGLSNKEGLALMCLAEALLRVPDGKTIDALIAEKISSGNWADHAGQSDSLLVNASTFGLMLTGRLIRAGRQMEKDPATYIKRLASRMGEPAIRTAMMQAMRIMGEQFVLGSSITEAAKTGRQFGSSDNPAIFSFDMLGEGARTRADAARYFDRYMQAIMDVGKKRGKGSVRAVSGVSVKLSALHPRYEALKLERVQDELYPKIRKLAEAAKAVDIGFCLDAEESDRLILSLQLFKRLAHAPSLAGWNGLGLAVQAYQKRALGVIEWLQKLARDSQRQLMVRLVKGAYWDTEIKLAQQNGMDDFPVWTTKQATDLNYLACARAMLLAPDAIFAQFATHNAHTVAAVQTMAEKADVAIEFQRLHGMGEALYKAADQAFGAVQCRIYAPVGSHDDLLPYLVRRLLENGANTSFVHAFLDENVPAEIVAGDPFANVETLDRHALIPTPPNLYGSRRRNAKGVDPNREQELATLLEAHNDLNRKLPLQSGPLVDGKELAGPQENRFDPAQPARLIGRHTNSNPSDLDAAFTSARSAASRWSQRGGAFRANLLRACADALEAEMPLLIALLAAEAGKTLYDSIAEVREAIDFCRYYAKAADEQFGPPARLPGPAGETNYYSLQARGIFICISPWNFPLAIFTGQVMAALAAGNTVLAKPAEQTPLIASMAVKLFFEAGLPEDVLHLLPGDGGTIGAALVVDERHDGVVFTGGTDTARIIQSALARRDGPIVPLIAETGGLNTMVVDTSALREQVIDDVIISAFGSAGQRCSALRLLLVPDETADELIEGVSGAMAELQLGDPADPATDIGPVIDAIAKNELQEHLQGPAICKNIHTQVNTGHLSDLFFGPALIEIKDLALMNREVFGPVLHVLRYKSSKLPQLLSQMADKKYGLTLGVHSRISAFADKVQRTLPTGNVYINRSMTGAVVGVQPFGGRGLSGTGPKAGGPHYLAAFATEIVVTNNISAQGGDPELLNLS